VAIVDSVNKHNITLKKITFLGRGEPTLNKQYPEMLTYAHHQLNNTILSMDTNATQKFKEEYLLLDWINCSVDGSTSASYETYRRGGQFASTQRFMQDAVRMRDANRSRCRIRWKYILFDTTSDPKLLDLAQKMAKNIGIDELDFVITAVGSYDGSVQPHKTSLEQMTKYITTNRIFPHTTVSLS
jgi:wyosine [tRNA(Phe)-imidazoG37] synthetase (radical SAM superfamily)